jgi:hypothetical protein
MRRPGSWLAVAVIMTVVACSGGEQTASTTAPTTTSIPATTSTTSPPVSTTTAESTTTTGATTTTATTDLPGELIDFGPARGDILAVIGVAHDDVLNLRSAPGADQDIVGEIPPLHADLTALGQTRQLPGSMWIAVEFDGADGWVNFSFVAYLGSTTDATASIVSNLGETPSADTMLDLGLIIARSLASEEPESDLVVTVAPTLGDLGEVTYDVIGLADDAVRGLRVHVFGQPGDDGFTLRTVEMTALCGRGADVDGSCI